jgi:hypothetical protein
MKSVSIEYLLIEPILIVHYVIFITGWNFRLEISIIRPGSLRWHYPDQVRRVLSQAPTGTTPNNIMVHKIVRIVKLKCRDSIYPAM